MSSHTELKRTLRLRTARIGSLIIPTDPYWIQALQAIIHTSHELGDELVLLQPAATLQELYTVPPQELVAWALAWIPFAFIFGMALFALVIMAALAALVIWIVGMLNALRGLENRLPVIGRLAERLPISGLR